MKAILTYISATLVSTFLVLVIVNIYEINTSMPLNLHGGSVIMYNSARDIEENNLSPEKNSEAGNTNYYIGS